MGFLRAIGRVPAAGLHRLVAALTALLDALTRLVGRLYDRFDADYAERTRLLRARYARPHQAPDAPSPGPVELAERTLL